MQIVIDMTEEEYNFFKNTSIEDGKMLLHQSTGDRENTISLIRLIYAIKNSIPLPKDHGRLIEVTEELRCELFNFTRYTGKDETPYEDATKIIDNAPAAIEADKEVE